jgi:hypothetical protein
MMNVIPSKAKQSEGSSAPERGLSVGTMKILPFVACAPQGSG